MNRVSLRFLKAWAMLEASFLAQATIMGTILGTIMTMEKQ